MMSLYLGVDLGGTKTAIGLVSEDGELLTRGEFPTASREGVEAWVERVGRAARELAQDRWADVRAAGMGSPGPMDAKAGLLICPPNLGWSDVPIRDLLAANLGKRVVLDNDANAAALGEARHGGDGSDSLVYITVSTGIGAGIVIDGKIHQGAFGGAGEFGHITLLPDGPRCNCGNYGCLEALSSGTAIARRTSAAVSEGRKSLVLDLAGGDPAKISASLVARAAAQGDELSREILADAYRFLGIGVVNLMNLIDPAVVAIGGGVTSVGEPLFAGVWAEVRRRALPPSRDKVVIRPPKLGADVALIGAAALAYEPRK